MRTSPGARCGEGAVAARGGVLKRGGAAAGDCARETLRAASDAAVPRSSEAEGEAPRAGEAAAVGERRKRAAGRVPSALPGLGADAAGAGRGAASEGEAARPKGRRPDCVSA